MNKNIFPEKELQPRKKKKTIFPEIERSSKTAFPETILYLHTESEAHPLENSFSSSTCPENS